MTPFLTVNSNLTVLFFTKIDFITSLMYWNPMVNNYIFTYGTKMIQVTMSLLEGKKSISEQNYTLTVQELFQN